MYNKMNGYAPFRSRASSFSQTHPCLSPAFSCSSGRMWGMSHSLPSGMDTDFSLMYNTRRGGMNFPASSTFGAAGHASSSSTSSLSGVAGTNLIINYLPQDMSERELYSLFSTMGPIESCKIMRDMKTGYSYGFGFINYNSEEAATRAIKCLNGLNVRNKRLKVSYARPSGDDIKETNLYVTNLPRTITEEMLDVIFGKYGTIVQKNILRDKITGQPRGVAFVRYNKREEAQEAISALNNVIPQGGNQPLTVRVAEEHGKAKGSQYLPTYNSVMHRGRQRMRMNMNNRTFPY
ncbi:sex-lethal homolog isoform X2 [Lutzomyia longipalpis]|uniref:sex-lethal homolog isoform X2 n=1 Tax=Lutzomyia longipalpis TaxID=7200 RepID=UPI002483A182|nr:sex-lethal homolog isoform X2 [Lutzomyia longipalpis]